MTYSDAHSHLHLPALATLSEAIRNAHRSCHLAAASEGESDWEQLDIWKQQDSKQRAICFGYHPNQADQVCLAKGIAKLQEALSLYQAAAIGEIGLDYALPTERKMQRELLEAQLKLAETLKLPVVIHAVKCHGDMLDTLASHQKMRVLIHGFYGHSQVLRRYLKLGHYVSLNASLFLRSPGTSTESKWREIVSVLPLERLMLESDCCIDCQGNPKSAASTESVAAQIATYKGCEVAEVVKVADYNMRNFYGL